MSYDLHIKVSLSDLLNIKYLDTKMKAYKIYVNNYLKGE